MGSVAEKRSLGIPFVRIPPQTITLQGVSYKSNTSGAFRVRCTPNLYLKIGDTAIVGENSFTVREIIWAVSADQETFEVVE